MENVLVNPFAGVNLVEPITQFGEGLLGAVQPLVVPVLSIGLAISAIPMGIGLFKRLASRIA